MAAGSGSSEFDPPAEVQPKAHGVSINLVDLWPPPERDPLLALFEAGVLGRDEFRMLYERRAVVCAAPPAVVPGAECITVRSV